MGRGILVKKHCILSARGQRGDMNKKEKTTAINFNCTAGEKRKSETQVRRSTKKK